MANHFHSPNMVDRLAKILSTPQLGSVAVPNLAQPLDVKNFRPMMRKQKSDRTVRLTQTFAAPFGLNNIWVFPPSP
jgi:hypothetical protein